MRFKLRAAALLLCLLLLPGLLVSCARAPAGQEEPPAEESGDAPLSTPERKGQRYADEIFSLNYEPEAALNPFQNVGAVNSELLPLMYEGLFRVNGRFEYENVLCSDCTTEDGLTYKLRMKPGVRFHDGSLFTAEDAAASLNLARESKAYASRLGIILAAYVLGGDLYIELSRANYNLPLLLDVPVIKAGTEEEAVPPGTGPYSYTDAGSYRYLKAFEQHRSRASLPADRIYLKTYSGTELLSAFDAGLIDLTVSSKADVSSMEFGGNTETRYAETTVFCFLGVNRDNPFLADRERRILLSSAIDRAALAEVLGGVPTTLPLNPAASFYSADYDPFTIRGKELEAAKQAYMVEDYDRDGWLEYMKLSEGEEEAGAPEDFTLKLIVNKENPVKLEAVRVLRESLAGQSFQLEVSELSWEEYQKALKNKKYDLCYCRVMLTADFDLTQLLSYGGSANYGVYDPELQTRIYDFNAAASGKADAAATLYTYIAQELPVISLAFERKAVCTHRETVTGLEPAPHDLFYGIENWEITLK